MPGFAMILQDPRTVSRKAITLLATKISSRRTLVASRCRHPSFVASARLALPHDSRMMTQTPLSATLLSTDDTEMLMKALHSKSPDVVQARMANALLLLADGLSVEDVAGLLYQSEAVVAGWQEMFAKRAAPGRGAKAA